MLKSKKKTTKCSPDKADRQSRCTCCSSPLKRNKSHAIFDEYGRFRRIQFLLAECMQRDVQEQSGAVQAICTDCLTQLDQQYAFKLKCQSAKQAQQEEEDDEDDDDDEDEEVDSNGDETVVEQRSSENDAEQCEGEADNTELESVEVKEVEQMDVTEVVITLKPEVEHDQQVEQLEPNEGVASEDCNIDVPLKIALPEVASPAIKCDSIAARSHDSSEFIVPDDNFTSATIMDYEVADHDQHVIIEEYVATTSDVETQEILAEYINDDDIAYCGQTESVETPPIVVAEVEQSLSDGDDTKTAAVVVADQPEIDELIQRPKRKTFVETQSPLYFEHVDIPDITGTLFVDSLTVHTIKEKLRGDIPTHPVHCASDGDDDDGDQTVANGQHSDSNGDDDGDCVERRQRAAAAASMLQLQQQSERAEQEQQPIDIDEYVMSLVTVTFDQNAAFLIAFACVHCSTKLLNYTALVAHTLEHRRCDDDDGDGEQLTCCLPDCTAQFAGDLDELKNHLFLHHHEAINASCFLTCATCHFRTESLTKFGKHVCCTDSVDAGLAPIVHIVEPNATTGANESPAPPTWHTCSTCSHRSRSVRRHHFHQQFHRADARPKLCLVCERLFSSARRFYEHVQFAHDRFEQHACRYCDRSFTLCDELRRHENAHTAARPHRCAQCDRAFISHGVLVAHQRSVHEERYECDMCGKLFSRKFRLRRHMQVHWQHEPAEMWMCGGGDDAADECGRVFEKLHAASEHWGVEHGGDADDERVRRQLLDEVFACEYCGSAYATVDQLLAHKARHDEAAEAAEAAAAASETPLQRFECARCPRRFVSYARLRSHANGHPEVRGHRYPVRRQFVCELDGGGCRKPYESWNNYQSHRKTVHLVNPSIMRCKLCDEVFYKSWLYAYHRKAAHSEHRRCPLCEQTFVLQRALDEHVAKAHVGEQVVGLRVQQQQHASVLMDELRMSDEDAVADVDDNGYGVNETVISTVAPKRALQRRKPGGRANPIAADKATSVRPGVHYAELDDGGGFRCIVCDKVAARRSNIVSHVQMVHMKVRNFECPQCQRGFYHRGDLNDHLKMHNSVTPFQCSYCTYAARTRSMITMHERTHTNERPYQCLQCPKAFKRQLVLNNHMRLHVGVKEFACGQCEMTFFTRYSLGTHEKMKHDAGAPEQRARARARAKAKNAVAQKTTIIVMPGPPDRSGRKRVKAERTEGMVEYPQVIEMLVANQPD